MTHHYDTFATRFGPFSVAVDASGRVAATAFGGRTRLRQRLSTDRLERNPTACAEAKRQISEYFLHRRRGFHLPLAPQGTEFQQCVWTALGAIPYGETRSYREIAARIDRPRAARAVGRANAKNPCCVLIPCHRVLGATGALVGFAFGTGLKRRLLALERPAALPVSSTPGRGRLAKRGHQGA